MVSSVYFLDKMTLTSAQYRGKFDNGLPQYLIYSYTQQYLQTHYHCVSNVYFRFTVVSVNNIILNLIEVIRTYCINCIQQNFIEKIENRCFARFDVRVYITEDEKHRQTGYQDCLMEQPSLFR